jgi:hypothetical protein
MSEFKINPAMQCKMRSKHRFLSWFLLMTFALNIGVTGWMFFRLSERIEAVDRKLQDLEDKDGGSHVQR